MLKMTRNSFSKKVTLKHQNKIDSKKAILKHHNKASSKKDLKDSAYLRMINIRNIFQSLHQNQADLEVTPEVPSKKPS